MHACRLQTCVQARSLLYIFRGVSPYASTWGQAISEQSFFLSFRTVGSQLYVGCPVKFPMLVGPRLYLLSPVPMQWSEWKVAVAIAQRRPLASFHAFFSIGTPGSLVAGAHRFLPVVLYVMVRKLSLSVLGARHLR